MPTMTLVRITANSRSNTGLATNGGPLFRSTITEVSALAGTAGTVDVVAMGEMLGRPAIVFVVPLHTTGRVLGAMGATGATQEAAEMAGRLRTVVGTSGNTNTRSGKRKERMTSTI